jgi:serine phosphatase RsbU (regulator of sigma subunit)
MWLVPIAGPTLEPIELIDKPDGLTIGRHEQCDICLPADAEKVSRFHARFARRDGRWSIADLSSRWGTFVNGIKINPGPDVPLSDSDLIRIMPWTFTLSNTPRRRGLQSQNDTGQTMVRAVTPERVRPMADDMLALLLESAAAIHGASDEKQLADVLMDIACRGTGLTNAAMLRPIDPSSGQIEVIAARLSPAAASTPHATYSRSLINAASNGVVAEIGGSTMSEDVSHSIVQMKINSAICVPLMLGTTVAAYLYLDSRGTMMQQLRPNASAFCVAIGRMASLALANLKRLDMEKREERIKIDLAAASVAQKWIMPSRSSCYGPFECTGESKPGQYVGGDFFDIIELSSNRLAVAVGDVAGKGIAASVLMTATQGFLHACLEQNGGDVGRAVTELNKFVKPRRPESKFVTMWVGVLDAEKRTISYVDAGHSYALLRRADGTTFEQLQEGHGLPVGLDEAGDYAAATAPFNPGDELVLVSDGIIEQHGLVQREDGSLSKEQFEVSGVRRAMSNAGADLVEDLFAAVVAHAGTTNLADDATAVLVKFRAGN